MWRAWQWTVSEGVLKYALEEDGNVTSYARVLDLWRENDEAFGRFFTDLLASCPFSSLRFETPPVTLHGVGDPFEFVLVDSPEIDLPPDPGAFQSQFTAREDDILVFRNLGGDAELIVPRPAPDAPGYAHLSDFLRHATFTRQLALWRVVGETVGRSMTDAPLWLNTAGGGVPWLHVRLDSRPKYYVFDAYRHGATA